MLFAMTGLKLPIRPMLIYFRDCKKYFDQRPSPCAMPLPGYKPMNNAKIFMLIVLLLTAVLSGIMMALILSIVIVLRSSNSYIDSDDDGVCLKSHDSLGAFCQNILVKNCTIRSSANGIKFGTAHFGGFRNVKLINIKVFDTYRSAIALRL
jgi:hypothetical protein